MLSMVWLVEVTMLKLLAFMVLFSLIGCGNMNVVLNSMDLSDVDRK